MTTCDDLRLGGTLADAGITGGLSINGTALSVADWSDILGHAGYRKTPISVSGRPGARMVGEGLPRPRFLNLDLNVGVLNPQGTLTVSECEQKQANTDAFLALVADPDGQYLELEMPDSSERFLHVYANDPGFISQPRKLRQIRTPLVAEWGYWRASVASTDTVSGADTVVVGGTVRVYDPIFTFAGDGTISTSDWSLTITGSGGAVIVDCGAREVTEGGNRADQLLTITSREWGWLDPGNYAITSTVSVGVKWRNQWP